MYIYVEYIYTNIYICVSTVESASWPSTVTLASKITTSSAKPLERSVSRSWRMKLSKPQPSPLVNVASYEPKMSMHEIHI